MGSCENWISRPAPADLKIRFAAADTGGQTLHCSISSLGLAPILDIADQVLLPADIYPSSSPQSHRSLNHPSGLHYHLALI